MMSIKNMEIFSILFIFLINSINCLINDNSYESCSYNIDFYENYNYSIGTSFIPSDASSCYKRFNTNYDKDIYKCCYEEYRKKNESENHKRCAPLKKDEFMNLKEYQSEIKESAEFEEFSISCEEDNEEPKNFNSKLPFSFMIYLFILLFI